MFSESQRYAAGSKPAVGRLAARTAAWVCALATISGSVVPAIALAGAVDDAKALNAKGAGLFKKGEYFDAAVAFEKAYALDARDFRVLRYAGRSWQEIGHWDRALTLLERYYGLETEEDLRASVLANLEKLRKATPAERAEALDKGAARYPQARLERDAARALEALGTAAALSRAGQLLEVARLGAATPAEKDAIDKELVRVKEAAKAAEAREASAAKVKPAEPVAPVKPIESKGITPAQWAAWGGGGALLASGAVLWVVGRGQTIDAAKALDDLPKSDSAARAKSKADYESGSQLYFAGIGLTVLGAVGVAAGFFLGSAERKVTLMPSPDGAALAVRF